MKDILRGDGGETHKMLKMVQRANPRFSNLGFAPNLQLHIFFNVSFLSLKRKYILAESLFLFLLKTRAYSLFAYVMTHQIVCLFHKYRPIFPCCVMCSYSILLSGASNLLHLSIEYIVVCLQSLLF